MSGAFASLSSRSFTCQADGVTSPSLADDEAALGRYAHDLADAIDAALPAWFDRCVSRFVSVAELADLPGGSTYRADATVAATKTAAAARELLERDIADQRLGPLEVLRAAVSFPTQVLRQAGVPPAVRDDFAERTFPDDVYDLSPASFGDVHESLHEPGLVWGAAKAHVHLRRRREAPPEPAPAEQHTVVLCTDLMDRSKISAAFPQAKFVRTTEALRERANEHSLVLVDLRAAGDGAALSDVAGDVIAFGSHVDEIVLAAAEQTGAQALPRSVFFKRLSAGTLR